MSKKGSLSWLDAAFNRYLLMDPEMAENISAFKGKVIAIDIEGFDRMLYLFPVDGRIELDDQYDGQPDTVLKGTPAALFRMGLSKNVAPMMLKGEIEISGDVRLGREFKKLLSKIDIDWEEHLARLLGDVPANQLMQLAKKLGDWGQRATQSFTSDLSEYLQEESRDVVSGDELGLFYQEVDRLRNDVDRFQAKLEVLKKGKPD